MKERWVYLCIHDDSLGLFGISRFVQEDSAEAIGMTHDRDSSASLDAPYKLSTPSRNDQVNVLF